ncbi:MAG: cell wall hydrolase [Oscillospiraceae bacterium]|nr:cell wall hydrolase [Oscillospiraceae bacterium]
MNSFFKIGLVSLIIAAFLAGVNNKFAPAEHIEIFSAYGSRGREVEVIQRTLRDFGLFYGEVTGYYGTQTEAAVRRFQQNRGLPATGIADSETLRLLGVNADARGNPEASEANIQLLARIISAEARGEPYLGQVAVGAVIMNRIQHPSFPDTLAGVIYQSGEFSAVWNGQFEQPVSQTALAAARDALAGWDPTGGAVYFYNPAKTRNAFLHARPVNTTIGGHRFAG